jgi:hypothetical protein
MPLRWTNFSSHVLLLCFRSTRLKIIRRVTIPYGIIRSYLTLEFYLVIGHWSLEFGAFQGRHFGIQLISLFEQKVL